VRLTCTIVHALSTTKKLQLNHTSACDRPLKIFRRIFREQIKLF